MKLICSGRLFQIYACLIMCLSFSNLLASEQHYDHVSKIIFVGESNTGKSTILEILTGDERESIEIKQTIGVDFKVRGIALKDKYAKATIWDTAGAERFRTLTSSYYRGANLAVVFYDARSPQISEWQNEIKQHASKDIHTIYFATYKGEISEGFARRAEGVPDSAPHYLINVETCSKENLEEIVSKQLDYLLDNNRLEVMQKPRCSSKKTSILRNLFWPSWIDRNDILPSSKLKINLIMTKETLNNLPVLDGEIYFQDRINGLLLNLIQIYSEEEVANCKQVLSGFIQETKERLNLNIFYSDSNELIEQIIVLCKKIYEINSLESELETTSDLEFELSEKRQLIASELAEFVAYYYTYCTR